MSTPKILIVDDEPFNVDYLEQELEELHYETVSACNGHEALEKVQSESPDLILLDIMMPVMDGFQVLSCLKKNPAARHIPVIVISANSDLQSTVKGIQLGAEDYLPKPFEPTLLHARISSSLEKKRLRDIEQLYLKSLQREFEIARNIQKGFLPSYLPRVRGWEIGAYFRAAREVAGDFYDAFLLPDGNLICVVGDVCDKGVGAALFMTLFRSLIRATCTTDGFYGENQPTTFSIQKRLAHVTSFTNDYVSANHGDSSMFATVFIGAFNLQDGTLTYANCGNEPPLILRNGCVVATLKPTGPAVGIIPDARFSVGEIALERGDLFLAYTDGIPDARNVNDESFGYDRLLTGIREAALNSMEPLEFIEEQMYSFVGETNQFDDITLMTVKRNP